MVWKLSGSGEARRPRALRLIGVAFRFLASYLTVQSTVVLAVEFHPPVWRVSPGLPSPRWSCSPWPRARPEPPVRQPGAARRGPGHPHRRATAVAVLVGLALNASLGWWWADPVAGYVLVYYAPREVKEILAGEH